MYANRPKPRIDEKLPRYLNLELGDKSPYSNLLPSELWRHFAALNAIPRPSGNEAAVREYIESVAHKAKALWWTDGARNLFVYVKSSSPKYSKCPVSIIQGHLDMVCEKATGIVHNFDTDPITTRIDGNKVVANGTTLGADNGIGVAAAIALLTTPGIDHGPLILLFTNREETGPWSASKLEAKPRAEVKCKNALENVRYLINLDSEDPEELTIGSVGGKSLKLTVDLEKGGIPSDWVLREIKIHGLKGGHSGMQIHEGRGNAIKIAADIIGASSSSSNPEIGKRPRLSAFFGGNADNAIPREVTAVIAMPPKGAHKFDEQFDKARNRILDEFKYSEPKLAIESKKTDKFRRLGWKNSAISKIVELIKSLPHGPVAFSNDFPGTVETSANLAKADAKEDHLEITVSIRSFVSSDLDMQEEALKRHASYVEVYDQYPAWTPNKNSKILEIASRAFKKINGHEARVAVLHGGLECGAIAEKFHGIEAISFGPRIQNPHTPEECVYIDTVESMWRLLVEVLKEITILK